MGALHLVCCSLLILTDLMLVEAREYTYKVYISTADTLLAGTDSSATIRFLSSSGGNRLLEKKLYPQSSNPYERDDTDLALVRADRYLGRIGAVEIKRLEDDYFDGWTIDKVKVVDEMGTIFTFGCRDCKISDEKWRTISVGSIECIDGYEKNNGHCQDINECNRPDACHDQNAICENTPGSFNCQNCKPGFKYDGHKCKDIDECITKRCPQSCVNTVGSFKCECYPGYTKGVHGCEDIDECAQKACDPLAQCKNSQGSYKCNCPVGYRTINNKKCENIDECKLDVCYWKTSDNCIDYDGGYKCHCRPGFYNKDNKTCDDVNECATDKPSCDLKVSKCVNMFGTYRCECLKGNIGSLDGKHCIGQPCPYLIVPNGATVDPPRCSQENANKYKDECTFSCQDGYYMKDTSLARRTCALKSTWTGQTPQCLAVSCGPLPAPASGRVIPSQCSSGGKYEDSCIFVCDDGYQLVGESKARCEANGKWSITTPVCKKFVDLVWIRCPPGITVDLKPGESTANVSGLWKKPQTSQYYNYLSSSHDGNHRFGVGKTTVTWTISHDNIHNKSCSFIVLVHDKEKPQATNCPIRTLTVYIGRPTERITLPLIKFTDNVAIRSISGQHVGEVVKSVGSYDVNVLAKDTSGNLGFCDYSLSVRAKYCDNIPTPTNGRTYCRTSNGNGFLKRCLVRCSPGTVTFNTANKIWNCDGAHQVWKPTPSVPDCVPSTPYDGVACPSGKVLMSSKMCVSCPSGMYFDNNSCKKCPGGTYQDIIGVIGRESCKKCIGNSFSEPGSSKKEDCKATCNPGYYSKDGYQPCLLCPVGEYQGDVRGKSCNKCPVDRPCTYGTGTSSIDNCGVCPTITKIVPKGNVTGLAGHDLELSCYFSTKTYARASWKTPFDKKVHILNVQNPITSHEQHSKVVIGRKILLKNLAPYHAGDYHCFVENQFGKDEKKVHVDVLVDGSGAGPLSDEWLLP